MDGAEAAVLANVDSIVLQLDPLEDTEFGTFTEIVNVFSAFGAFLGPLGSFGEVTDALASEADALVEILQSAVMNDSSIGEALNPSQYSTGTTDSEVLQIADLKTQLSNIVEEVKTNIERTFNLTMLDWKAFIAFAGQGIFSEGPPASLDKLNKYLFYTFNTYIISKALNGNNIYGVLGRGTNPQNLTTNGTHLAYDVGPCPDFNTTRICDAWWYSDTLNSSFGLDDFSHMNRPYGGILTNLFSTLTSGQLLFESAYNCHSQSSLSSTSGTDAINATCPSQLQLATWDMSCDDPTDTKNQCEFLEKNIARQNDFLDNNDATGSLYSSGSMDLPYPVPNSYLGPLIAQTEYKLRRN